jgi:hypothetical protein
MRRQVRKSDARSCFCIGAQEKIANSPPAFIVFLARRGPWRRAVDGRSRRSVAKKEGGAAHDAGKASKRCA